MRLAPRHLAAATALVALIALAAPAASAEQARGSQGDRVLEEIVAEEEIDTEASVSVLEYAAHLRDWLFGRLEGRLAGTPWLERIAFAVLWTLVIGLPVLAGFLVLRQLLRGGRRSTVSRDDEASEAVELPAEEDLRARLHDELGRGDALAALRALWLFLARGLSAAGHGEFAPDVTNREFVASVRETSPSWEGLGELETLARSSDRWLYRDETVELEDVRAMARRAEEWLG